MNAHDSQLLEAMQQLGYKDFSSVEQEEMIRSVLDNKDVLAIMPTGGGKTAGAVLPAMVNDWCVLIVSPLKALMNDQCESLRAFGLQAHVVNGDTSPEEFSDIFHLLRQPAAGPMFVFTTPEMALTVRFKTAVQKVTFHLMMVDEVHCVSTWGSGFREKYQRIGAIWKSLGRPQILAVSATADPFIIESIKLRVPFRKKQYVEIIGDPVRTNLHLAILHPPSGMKKQMQVKEYMVGELKSYLANQLIPTHGPTIIYCSRVREAEELMIKLGATADENGYSIALYHGQLDTEHRAASLRVFRTAKKPLIIATSAFGMGIDREDVRTIVHFGPPSDLVEFAQQIGRAGRDGNISYCWTLYMPWMIDRQKRAEVGTIPDLEEVEKTYKMVRRAWQTVQEKNQTRMHLDKFHFVHDTWLLENPEVFNPQKHIAMRRESIKILAKLGYLVQVDDYVTGVKAMSFGTSTHNQLIEMTEMETKRAARDAARLRKFFTVESPDQSVLFDLIAADTAA